MNYSKIVKAMPELGKLLEMRLPYAIARDIHKIHRACESEYQFYAAEERKLIFEIAAKDDNGNPKIADGRVSFDTVELMRRYQERITELGATDANVEIPSVTLTATDIGDELISAKTIDALDGIINFA